MNYQTFFAKNKILLAASFSIALAATAFTALPINLQTIFDAFRSASKGIVTNTKSDHQSPISMLYDYDKAWAEIDSLEANGLPKSALTKTEELLAQARKEANAPQTIKALIFQGKYLSQLEEEGLPKAVSRIQAEIELADIPVKPILQSMLAEMYTNYLQQNYWRFSNRTQTLEFKPADLKTWSLEQLHEEASKLYWASLSDARLKTTAIGDFKLLLTEGHNDEGLRPTLYDFLAHRAIDYFMDESSHLTAPAYKFYIDDERAFATAAEFVNWKIETPDTSSKKLKTLQLFQDLLRFHLSEKMLKNPASLDTDLKRLSFAYTNAVLDTKEAAYLSALENLRKNYEGSPAAAEVLHSIAAYYAAQANLYQPLPYGVQDSDERRIYFVKAHDLCKEAMEKYPGSFGARQCAIMIQELEAKTLFMTVEQVNLPEQPFLIKVDYKNLQVAHLKVVKLTKKELEKIEAFRQESNDEEKILSLLNALPPVKAWASRLPDDGDFRSHSTEVKVDGLPFGTYALLLADNRDFKKGNSTVLFATFHSSNLGYWLRNGQTGPEHIVVLDRRTGAPLSGAKVDIYFQHYNALTYKYQWKHNGQYVTDANGMVSLPELNASNVNLRFVICHQKDSLDTGDTFYKHSYRNTPRTYQQTAFFLDREIYRPGQTVYFKGIAIHFDEKRMPTIIKNQPVTVTFLDANHQVSATLNLRTNDYGTISGQFTSPKGGLLGTMFLRSSIGDQQKNFRVEEYKRPKFEVTFEPVKGSFRLNDEVTMVGKAVAFAGNNIDGAKVNYRVVRQANYPWLPWWYFRYYPPQGEEMEISNGTVTTDAEGKFQIKFKALPDRSIGKEKKPEYSYSVYADVTDISGETQSGSNNVSVGYVALRADVPLAKEINLDSLKKLTLVTNNLSGTYEPAKGTIKLDLLRAPNTSFLSRYWEKPDRQVMTEEEFKKAFPKFAYGSEDMMENWPVERNLLSVDFDTEKSKEIALPKAKLTAGWYVVTLNTQDKYGEKIEVKKYFSGYDLSEKALPAPTLVWHKLTKAGGEEVSNFEPGDQAALLFGTTEAPIHVLLELTKDNSILLRKWVNVKRIEQELQSILEAHRGNLHYFYSYAKDGRSFNQQGSILVPWSNKDLTIEYGTFRDKLLPGQQEEWTIKVKGPKGDKVAAEMVAGMYDASLDAFAANNWGLNVWPSSYSNINYQAASFQNVQGQWLSYFEVAMPEGDHREYRQLNWFNWYMYEYNVRLSYQRGSRNRNADMLMDMEMESAPAPSAAMAEEKMAPQKKSAERADSKPLLEKGAADTTGQGGDGVNKPNKPTTDLSQVQVRTNLNETVFFYPNLMTDAEGNVVIKFKMNEALTKWKFLGLATTPDLQVATTTKEVVTQKDLMVVPNPPRFFREFDEIEFTAKVVNLSKETLNGEYKLELKNALNGLDLFPMNGTNPAMAALLAPQRLTDLKPGESRRLAWRFKVPDVADVPVIEHTVIASAGNFSDAERSAAPVLSNRMLVTETLPMPVRGGQTRNFTLNSLKNNNSNTLRHQGLTLEFTQNPAWYAVQALPYLMEYPYECNEQIFSRYYANSLATSVANSHPKVKQVFDRWRAYEPEALKSNLSKNQELKTALLEETPWVLNAQSEEQQKQNIALLFDLNRMSYEQEAALDKLRQRQWENGGWGWFPGDPDNWYISQYILEGLGHLQRLGVQDVMGDPQSRNMVERAINYCDYRILEHYERLKREVEAGKAKWEDDHLDYMVIHYLYTRSFFLENKSAQAGKNGVFSTATPQTLNDNNQKVHDYYIGQAEKYWLNKGMYSEGMLALSLDRAGKSATAQKITKSLKERSLNNEEMGMYWKYPMGWWWYQAPIETHALLIEVFKDVANDAQAVDDLKVWLLKNKQTSHWKTTKATASAVYALLSTGDNWLLEDQPLVINFGSPTAPQPAAWINPIKEAQKGAEAGTGYFKVRYDGKDVQPGMGNITVSNPNKVVAWGAIYWQYFEQLDKIKTFEETPLTIKKQLFKVENSATGEVLKPINDQNKLKVGDKVKVRIELRVDRDMEYVHMKDMRASSFEPINVLSTYKWQGGLGYYESTRDAATNFFFSYLPKGTHVFEYPLRVTYNGDFSNGITTIQCMYAPEFSSHSEGVRVKVEN